MFSFRKPGLQKQATLAQKLAGCTTQSSEKPGKWLCLPRSQFLHLQNEPDEKTYHIRSWQDAMILAKRVAEHLTYGKHSVTVTPFAWLTNKLGFEMGCLFIFIASCSCPVVGLWEAMWDEQGEPSDIFWPHYTTCFCSLPGACSVHISSLSTGCQTHNLSAAKSEKFLIVLLL